MLNGSNANPAEGANVSAYMSDERVEELSISSPQREKLLAELLEPPLAPASKLHLRRHRFGGEHKLLVRICNEFPDMTAQILRSVRSHGPSPLYRWLKWDRIAAQAIDPAWDRLAADVGKQLGFE